MSPVCSDIANLSGWRQAVRVASADASVRNSPEGSRRATTIHRECRLGSRLVELARALHHDQYQLVVTAADSGEWAAEGATSAGAWLAATADVEAATAREWIRIGRRLQDLPVIAAEFATGGLSYAKVRTLTRVATTDNETELAALAHTTVPAADLGTTLAGWRNRHHSGAEIDAYHHQHRSLLWRTDPDGMVTFTIRLPPHLAATLIALLTTLVWNIKERNRACVDCGRQGLLHYDHNPPFRHTRRTVIDELELRCAPCHRRRHRQRR